QEHQLDEIEAMLERFKALITAIIETNIVVLAAVRGQCLGGGLELAALAHRIFAHRDAKFGQPEIALGVFAPFASMLLPLKIARADAEDLCVSGRTVTAGEAAAMRLVDSQLTDDPTAAAVVWARTHLADKSASSLRVAVKAIRADLVDALTARLP